MRIQVRDYRGAERVDLACEHICLIAGANAQGKTSTIQAVAAALTGAALPIPGLTKSAASALVRIGCSAGSVEIRTAAGSAKVTWPGCEISADGDPPRASRSAAGLDNPVDLRPEDRAKFFAELLKSDPTHEDFAAAMADKGLGDDAVIAALWKLVTEKGWDGACTLRKEKGAEMRGRWRQVAGTNYGSRIAASWAPAHWTDDLEEQTERELEAVLADAKEAQRKAIAAAAAGDTRRELLEAEAGKIEERAKTIEEKAAVVVAADQQVSTLRAERDALPPSHGSAGMPCPHCGEKIIIVNRNLAEQAFEKAPPPIPEGELKERRRRRAELDGALSNAEAKASQAKREVAAAEAALAVAQKAQAELDGLLPKTAGGADTADADAAVVRAEQRLAAFKAKAEADSIRDRINSNDLAIDILAPDGLRARKLAKVLDLFNGGQLAPLCERARWKAVTIGPDMAITYGGRDVRLLSASEAYRVRAILQIAVAKLDGSMMVVLDAADILDATERSGLLNLLIDTALPALLALTLSKREQTLDLAAAGVGASYWISEGIAEPIGAAAQREAA